MNLKPRILNSFILCTEQVGTGTIENSRKSFRLVLSFLNVCYQVLLTDFKFFTLKTSKDLDQSQQNLIEADPKYQCGFLNELRHYVQRVLVHYLQVSVRLETLNIKFKNVDTVKCSVADKVSFQHLTQSDLLKKVPVLDQVPDPATTLWKTKCFYFY